MKLSAPEPRPYDYLMGILRLRNLLRVALETAKIWNELARWGYARPDRTPTETVRVLCIHVSRYRSEIETAHRVARKCDLDWEPAIEGGDAS